jgi:hypothetical protein
MAFKLIESAQARCRAVNAPHLVALIRTGAAASAVRPPSTLSTLTLLSRGVAQVIEQGLVLFCFTRWFCWLSCRRAGRVVFWVCSWVRS